MIAIIEFGEIYHTVEGAHVRFSNAGTTLSIPFLDQRTSVLPAADHPLLGGLYFRVIFGSKSPRPTTIIESSQLNNMEQFMYLGKLLWDSQRVCIVHMLWEVNALAEASTLGLNAYIKGEFSFSKFFSQQLD